MDLLWICYGFVKDVLRIRPGCVMDLLWVCMDLAIPPPVHCAGGGGWKCLCIADDGQPRDSRRLALREAVEGEG